MNGNFATLRRRRLAQQSALGPAARPSRIGRATTTLSPLSVIECSMRSTRKMSRGSKCFAASIPANRWRFQTGLMEVDGALIRDDRARYFFHRCQQLQAKLARACRVRLGRTQSQSRLGVARRQGFPRYGRRPGHRLHRQERQAPLVDSHRGSRQGRVGAGGADRVEWAGVHRQRRRGQQGREGPRCMRWMRRPVTSCGSSTWCRRRRAMLRAAPPRRNGRERGLVEECERHSRHGRRDLDFVFARPGQGASLRAWRQSRHRISRKRHARATIYSQVRSWFSTPRPAHMQRHFQLVKRDFHDWDVSSAPVLFLSNSGHRMMAEAPKGWTFVPDRS